MSYRASAKKKGKGKKKFVSVGDYITKKLPKKKKEKMVTTFTMSTHGSSPLASEMFSSTFVDPKALY